MNNIVREALTSRPESIQEGDIEWLTWYDYVWLNEEQIANIEKKIWYNPNIEWELKNIIDKWLPTSWPAMQNVLKTLRAKDEKQLWQWIDHYKNKVNASASKAWEDVLILLAQLWNLYEDDDRIYRETVDWKKQQVLDTNIAQWRWWGWTWIKYNQIINQLLLNKVTEAREKWATFWQMTEYEWDILKDAASALKIKFWYWSSDESFTKSFYDLVNASWKLSNWTNTWPTESQWKDYVDKIRKEDEWYVTSPDWTVISVDWSNLWWWSSKSSIWGNNEETMNTLFNS
jgi:hypothetical protein